MEQSLSNVKGLNVSEILKGNFTPVAIPVIEIPGSRPLVYSEPAALLAEINEKDEFFIDEIEEEFLMFTAELEDSDIRRKMGPHQTLRWRKLVRNDPALSTHRSSQLESQRQREDHAVTPIKEEESVLEENAPDSPEPVPQTTDTAAAVIHEQTEEQTEGSNGPDLEKHEET